MHIYVIMSEVDIVKYSKIIILILFPEVMNSTTGNTYRKYRFKNHNHLIKIRNIFNGDCLANTVNVYNKL